MTATFCRQPQCFMFLILVLCNTVKPWSLSNLFSGDIFGSTPKSENVDLISAEKVPYELAVQDEKFISEATKLTGVALSDLDMCQQRVVLKLRTSCQKMNDEQLSKMAVMLLNCQSAIEGRPLYPCTDAMSLQQCTINMDADTWNSYHLMANRARAVCYAVRQEHFRGLTEITVNKLMGTAHEQLNMMSKLSDGQNRLEKATENTVQIVTSGNKMLKDQQEDLLKAQLHGQFMVEDNLKRLSDEKRLIVESHEHIALLTQDVKRKLDEAALQLERQAEQQEGSQKHILNDLLEIQKQAQLIFDQIESSSQRMMERSAQAAQHYEATLTQLSQMNNTIYTLVNLINSTRSALEERLGWLTETLGGTDVALERIYLLVVHCLFLLLAMVACSFLQISSITRLAVVVLVPVNFALAVERGSESALSLFGLTTTIITFAGAQFLYFVIYNLFKKYNFTLPFASKKPVSRKSPEVTQKQEAYPSTSLDNNIYSSGKHYLFDKMNQINEESDTRSNVSDDFGEPTPPVSRNGLYPSRSGSNTPVKLRNGSVRSSCNALTRLGTPCKMSALPGREYCHQHQSGTSVVS